MGVEVGGNCVCRKEVKKIKSVKMSNNYKGIDLLSVAEKLFSTIVTE